MDCNFVPAGRTRGGRQLFYCEVHGYYTTDPSRPCPGSVIDRYSKGLQEVDVDIVDYPGGIGVWGALPPVVDTTRDASIVFGVHLHARREPGGEKEIDATFRRVRVFYDGRLVADIDADTAVNYTLSVVAGLSPGVVRCSHCGALHTDKGALAVRPHRVHLCHRCKRRFRAEGRGVGSRLALLRELLPRFYEGRRRVVPGRSIEVDLGRDEVRLWAANPAILWTAPRPEEEGVHVHLYRGGVKVVDETFGRVVVNGRVVDPEAARVLMAQRAYSIIVEDVGGRLSGVVCPRCGEPVLYRGELAFRPATRLVCPRCGHSFRVGRAVIPQPLAWLARYW